MTFKNKTKQNPGPWLVAQIAGGRPYPKRLRVWPLVRARTGRQLIIGVSLTLPPFPTFALSKINGNIPSGED